jgi:hypothetical protein
MKKRKTVVNKLRELDVIVFDEASMISSNAAMPRLQTVRSVVETFIHFIHRVLQRIRNSSAPFGGVVTRFVGDFFQLPPADGCPKYLFEATCLRECQVVQLNIVHRQSGHMQFQRLLHSVANARTISQCEQALTQLQTLSARLPDPAAITLYCTRFPVRIRDSTFQCHATIKVPC